MAGKMLTIGVLALQGAVKEHLDALSGLSNVKAILVKTPEEIKTIDGLILPGGESSAMGNLLTDFELLEPLKLQIANGLPTWGTCAGMILLAKKIENQTKTYFGCMDIEVKRNAYGSQLDSFQTEVSLPEIAAAPIPLVFIRAPYITGIHNDVENILTLNGKIVAARQNNMLATSFHPELTKNLSFHRYFIDKLVNCSHASP